MVSGVMKMTLPYFALPPLHFPHSSLQHRGQEYGHAAFWMM